MAGYDRFTQRFLPLLSSSRVRPGRHAGRDRLLRIVSPQFEAVCQQVHKEDGGEATIGHWPKRVGAAIALSPNESQSSGGESG